jgi:hypothetical protein
MVAVDHFTGLQVVFQVFRVQHGLPLQLQNSFTIENEPFISASSKKIFPFKKDNTYVISGVFARPGTPGNQVILQGKTFLWGRQAARPSFISFVTMPERRIVSREYVPDSLRKSRKGAPPFLPKIIVLKSAGYPDKIIKLFYCSTDPIKKINTKSPENDTGALYPYPGHSKIEKKSPLKRFVHGN